MHTIEKSWQERAVEEAVASFNDQFPEESTERLAALEILPELQTNSGVECRICSRLQKWNVVSVSEKAGSEVERVGRVSRSRVEPKSTAAEPRLVICELPRIADAWATKLNEGWGKSSIRFARDLTLKNRQIKSYLPLDSSEEIVASWDSSMAPDGSSGILFTDRRLIVYELRRRKRLIPELAWIQASYSDIAGIDYTPLDNLPNDDPNEATITQTQILIKLWGQEKIYALAGPSGKRLVSGNASLKLRDFISEIIMTAGAGRFQPAEDAIKLYQDQEKVMKEQRPLEKENWAVLLSQGDIKDEKKGRETKRIAQEADANRQAEEQQKLDAGLRRHEEEEMAKRIVQEAEVTPTALRPLTSELDSLLFTSELDSLLSLSKKLVPNARFSTVAIACWKSGRSRAENFFGGLAVRLATGGFVGGPTHYEHGIIGIADDSLYLISFGLVSGFEVNNGGVNYEKTGGFNSRSDLLSNSNISHFVIRSLNCSAKWAEDFVNMEIHGDLRTEVMLLESFVPGNVKAGVAIASALTK